MRLPVLILAMSALAPAAPGALQVAQRGPEPQERRDSGTSPQVKVAIDKLSSLDFPVRTAAARTVRRAAPAVAVPALLEAIAGHADGYVRFRSLVLLSGFNDARTPDVMAGVLPVPNDRLRTVGYAYFEHHQDSRLIPALLEALNKEESEFVRPALTRTLASYGADPRVREAIRALVVKGQDFFRSAVIEALGDYKAAYALPLLTDVAKLDGPLQDDAVIAIGKIGDKRSLEILASLQRAAPRAVQPSIAAAICLIGVNCSSHQGYLEQSLRFAIANPGFQELLRASASGLAALAVAGSDDAVKALVDAGGPSRDPARAAIALALGTIALRNTPVMLRTLEQLAEPKPAIALLGEAFDMLEEDLEEERFFAIVRRGYWAAAEGSPARKLATALIQTLEF